MMNGKFATGIQGPLTVKEVVMVFSKKRLSRIGLFLIILFGVGFISLNAGGSGDIVGKWKWFNGAEVTFYSNGAVDASNNAKGSWQCADPAGRVYVVKWTNGWTDTLTLSTDGQRLRGKNNMGAPVTATRKK
jgi:hypothetical protein